MNTENDNKCEIPHEVVEATLQPQGEFVDQLVEDLCQIIRNEVEHKGFICPTFDIDPRKNRHALITAYCSMLGRRVAPAKRRVHLNPSLSVPDEVAGGFELLVRKFENGEDVNPHLNKFSAKLDKNDQLLYDWGINHFHLGTALDPSGFIKRTGPIAYAIVKENDVYIITVTEHGHWSDKDLLEIVDTNWPELIAGWKIDGEWEADLSSEEIRNLRKAGISCGIKLANGNSYFSPGGGINCAGGSTFAVIEANKMYHCFRDLHKYYEGKFYLDPKEVYFQTNGPQINMRLKRQNNDLYLYLDNLDWELKWLKFRNL